MKEKAIEVLNEALHRIIENSRVIKPTAIEHHCADGPDSRGYTMGRRVFQLNDIKFEIADLTTEKQHIARVDVIADMNKYGDITRKSIDFIPGEQWDQGKIEITEHWWFPAYDSVCSARVSETVKRRTKKQIETLIQWLRDQGVQLFNTTKYRISTDILK
ncbi:hypothetical protein KAU40_00280 [Candidatus Parcubacteria bacterium]|nr:hypothetical protein [Candidatus Parcubacteria bacterium]